MDNRIKKQVFPQSSAHDCIHHYYYGEKVRVGKKEEKDAIPEGKIKNDSNDHVHVGDFFRSSQTSQLTKELDQEKIDIKEPIGKRKKCSDPIVQPENGFGKRLEKDENTTGSLTSYMFCGLERQRMANLPLKKQNEIMNSVCGKKTGLVDWTITNKNQNSRFGKVKVTPEHENVGRLMKLKEDVHFAHPSIKSHMRATKQPIGQKPTSIDVIPESKVEKKINAEKEEVILKYRKKECKPDKDLGTSWKTLKYDLKVPDNPTRVYGLPSIRLDLPVPESLSITNLQNFGNDANMGSLISGSMEGDLTKNKSKEDCKLILMKANIFEEEIFEGAILKLEKEKGTYNLQDVIDAQLFIKYSHLPEY